MTLPVFPAVLNEQITQQGYGREDGTRFNISEPASGPHYAQLLTDDSPTTFTLQMILNGQHARLFRAWQRSNNYAVLHGQQFLINLRTEDGMLQQTASFLPGGIPQVQQIVGDETTYTMRILVRRIVETSPDFESFYWRIDELGDPNLLQTIVNDNMPEI